MDRFKQDPYKRTTVTLQKKLYLLFNNNNPLTRNGGERIICHLHLFGVLGFLQPSETDSAVLNS